MTLFNNKNSIILASFLISFVAVLGAMKALQQFNIAEQRNSEVTRLFDMTVDAYKYPGCNEEVAHEIGILASNRLHSVARGKLLAECDDSADTYLAAAILAHEADNRAKFVEYGTQVIQSETRHLVEDDMVLQITVTALVENTHLLFELRDSPEELKAELYAGEQIAEVVMTKYPQKMHGWVLLAYYQYIGGDNATSVLTLKVATERYDNQALRELATSMEEYFANPDTASQPGFKPVLLADFLE